MAEGEVLECMQGANSYHRYLLLSEISHSTTLLLPETYISPCFCSLKDTHPHDFQVQEKNPC